MASSVKLRNPWMGSLIADRQCSGTALQNIIFTALSNWFSPMNSSIASFQSAIRCLYVKRWAAVGLFCRTGFGPGWGLGTKGPAGSPPGRSGRRKSAGLSMKPRSPIPWTQNFEKASRKWRTAWMNGKYFNGLPSNVGKINSAEDFVFILFISVVSW